MKERVLAYIDEHKMDLAEMLSDLIKIDSQNQGVPNTAHEEEAQARVFEIMDGMGLEPKKLAYDEAQVRPNVYGTYKGSGCGRSLMINGHIDTVAVTNADAWIYPPLGGVICDNKVHGRGASDDKMAVTAMICAVDALQKCGVKLKGDVMLLSSVGEESGEGVNLGAGPAVRDMPRPDFAIVSEATCMDMDVESSSICYFQIKIKGKAAHPCGRNQIFYPQRVGLEAGSEIGVDALYKAMPIIDLFYRLERDWNTNRRYPIWGAGGTPVPDGKGMGAWGFNPSIIEGGEYIGAVMNSVTLTYVVAYPPFMKMEDVRKEIEDAVAAVASTDSWLKQNPPEITMPYKKVWPGFSTSVDEPGVKALQAAFKESLGREVSLTSNKSVMDTTFISTAGIPVVALGPGGPETNQHGTNEWASIDLLADATKVYAAMMMDWCEIDG